MWKHRDKILFVIGLSFYAWGIFDRTSGQWPMIGGTSTFILLVLDARRKKGERLMDFGMILLMLCVIISLGLQVFDSLTG